MRKILLVMLLILFIQSCAPAQVTNTPQPTSTTFITYTPIDTPTQTFTPIPTASPTIVRIPTQDPNAIATFPIVPIFIGDVTATQPLSLVPTSSRPGPGFVSVSYSPTKMYWGGCEANQAVINATVEDYQAVAGVIIFMRVKSATRDDSTPWTKGNIMYDNKDGTFTFIAVGSEIQGHNHYKDSFVVFQLISVDKKGKENGRTKIYDDIFMSPCPCLTPVSGCPINPKSP
ncbi:MAG: hypothetical protein KF758_13485 [Anaerolineales bacterium]|nr:hypothetical protein [Anaerolineales bacterium]